MSEAIESAPPLTADQARGPVAVAPVRGLGDLRAFIDLPFRLHARTPWIPPLKLERYLFLNRRLNPYFTHGEAEYFLARRGGHVVGRVTAQIDHAFNEFHHARWGMFGFLELEDDQEVMDGLLDAAAAWLAARGCERMVGPMDFQMNDESGVLIDGFDLEPMIRQPWHPPYYQRRCEAAGLTKAMDLYSWRLEIGLRATRMLPILPKTAERARSRYGVTIRKMSRRRLRREMDEFAKVYNAAWSGNWGFVPYGKKDLDEYARTMHLVFSREWFMVAEIGGETVGVAMAIPDVNQVLKRMRGRLLPTGWWHFLNKSRIIDRVRVGFLGVVPEYQHTGAAAALYMELFDVGERMPQHWGEASWILETNRSMNRGLKAMGGEIVKRHRIYERRLGETAGGRPEPLQGSS